MRSVVILFAVLCLSVSADSIWTGNWQVQPAPHSESCCFPATPVDLNQTGNTIHASGTWASSSVCAQAGIAGKSWAQDVNVSFANTSDLALQYNLGNGVIINGVLTNEGNGTASFQSVVLGVNCRATFVRQNETANATVNATANATVNATANATTNATANATANATTNATANATVEESVVNWSGSWAVAPAPALDTSYCCFPATPVNLTQEGLKVNATGTWQLSPTCSKAGLAGKTWSQSVNVATNTTKDLSLQYNIGGGLTIDGVLTYEGNTAAFRSRGFGRDCATTFTRQVNLVSA